MMNYFVLLEKITQVSALHHVESDASLCVTKVRFTRHVLCFVVMLQLQHHDHAIALS